MVRVRHREPPDAPAGGPYERRADPPDCVPVPLIAGASRLTAGPRGGAQDVPVDQRHNLPQHGACGFTVAPSEGMCRARSGMPRGLLPMWIGAEGNTTNRRRRWPIPNRTPSRTPNKTLAKWRIVAFIIIMRYLQTLSRSHRPWKAQPRRQIPTRRVARAGSVPLDGTMCLSRAAHCVRVADRGELEFVFVAASAGVRNDGKPAIPRERERRHDHVAIEPLSVLAGLATPSTEFRLSKSALFAAVGR